jgi:glycosyltransferase involved in cell wall biosynthesis
MKVTLIAVCRNEAATGHIEKFLKWNVPLFDHILVYDDASNDGTVNLLKRAGINVLENEVSMFRNELLIREKLLAEAKVRFPETDWFMILDLDEILTCEKADLIELIEQAEVKKCTGVSFKLVNLWKSEEYFRTDEYFNKVEKIHLWKNVPAMYFSGESGLHRELHPISIKAIYAQDSIRILHLGFSTREKIVRKFLTYKNLGQEGRSLWRLIDERFMETQALSTISSKLGRNINNWINQANLGRPSATSTAHYLWDVRELEGVEVREEKKPLVTLVCLIYSGIDWLEFAYGELLLLQKEFEQGEIEILFCANDATREVLDFLKFNNIPHIEFNNPDPNEHYISRVYRAYNFATMKANAKFCLLVNSDMAYAPGFLTKMLLHRDRNSFVVAKLVESGTLRPGPLAIKKNFGKTLQKFRRKAFYKFALGIEQTGLAEGGLFMPLLVSRDLFLSLGGFPEGNLTPDSLPTYLRDDQYKVAVPGMPCVSGDDALFMKAELSGIKHVTSLRSIAYHFQEGEKRHTSQKVNRKIRSGFAIANDSLSGINSERVLWDVLSEILEKKSLQVHKWNTGKIIFPLRFLRQIAHLNFSPKTIPRVCLQNASYLPIIDKDARGMALLQDNLFDSRLVRMQTKVLHNAQSVVTNSIPMINLDAKNHFIWQPLPISDLFIHSAPTAERMPNTCIFVGAFDETKGWSEVREIIIENPTISFDLVSKYDHDSPGNLSDFPNNVKIHRKLSQEELVRLYDSASFFILGSPLETQCLAAIEAAARGVIVIMKKTGMLAESSYANEIGFFGDDLAKAFAEALDSGGANFHPRETLLKMRLTNLVLEEEWEGLLLQELRKSFYPNVNESRTLRERVVRRLSAPRMVSEHA